MEFFFPILIFGLFIGVFAWLMITQGRKQKARDAAVDQLASQQGWQVERRPEGRRRVTTITPNAGGWTLRLAPPTSTGNSKSRTSIPGFSEFRADLPNWPGGRAIFSPKLPGGMERLVGSGSGLVGFLQATAVKTVLRQMVGSDSLAEIGQLQPFDPPPGIELSILSTEDPRDGNLRAIHDVIHGWKPRHRRDRSPPAVTIGPEGTLLRLPACLDLPDDIADLVETGCRLARDLGGA
jgi:hypothetical protein